MISNETNLLEKIDQLKEKENLKGILLKVNSPGGTFVSSKEIYDSLKFFNETIPIAIYMKEVATSGAYLVFRRGQNFCQHWNYYRFCRCHFANGRYFDFT